MKTGLGDHFNELELVEADLLDEDSIVRACENATYVIHTASPVSFSLPDDEIIKPAV